MLRDTQEEPPINPGEKKMSCIAYIDGGRVPGTKHTTIGGIIKKDHLMVAEYSLQGEDGSNSDAEYQSLIYCLKIAQENQIKLLHIKTDAKIIADLTKSEYDILLEMVSKLEIAPGNRGLLKAIRKRCDLEVKRVDSLKRWLEENKVRLENTQNYPAKYRDSLLTAFRNVMCSFELIPREENSVADALCRKAREHAC